MPHAHLNRIATAVPPHEVHGFFLQFARSRLGDDARRLALFERMAEMGGIERRYSCLAPAEDPEGPFVDAGGLFPRSGFPGTAERMRIYEEHAPELAASAVARLLEPDERAAITHLIVTSCTGFSAPGIDLEIIARCGLSADVERTIIGFMGCYAAINALKLARHIVRSTAQARVLIVNLELCTLHLKETGSLEELLSFCLWGDGCAAALVTADPAGLRLDRFRAVIAPETRQYMSWHIRDHGFDMVLSGQVPALVQEIIARNRDDFLDGTAVQAIDLWAIHPGGRSILDAAQRALRLTSAALQPARGVLRDHGNMSSATVMFVLAALLAEGECGARGCAMAFGPGLVAETMLFRRVA